MTENEIEFLQQENDRLKNEVRDLREKEKGIHAGYKKQLSDVRRDHALGLLLVGLKTEFDDLPANVKVSALTEITNNRLMADAAELSVDEAGQLTLRKKDGTNFFSEDHHLLTPKSYLDRILTRDKILKSDDQAPTPTTSNKYTGEQYGHNSSNNNGRNYRKNNMISHLVDESLKSFSEG